MYLNSPGIYAGEKEIVLRALAQLKDWVSHSVRVAHLGMKMKKHGIERTQKNKKSVMLNKEIKLKSVSP